MAGGGSLGVLLGGVLTDTLSWHWIFLVNLPIGIAVAALTLMLLPADEPASGPVRLDVAGAVTITLALLLRGLCRGRRRTGRLDLGCRPLVSLPRRWSWSSRS